MKVKSHWHHAILTFALTVLAAGILLPLIRVQPVSVHEYFNGVNDWIRISFAFSLCVVFTGVMFKLLTPRLGHLAHWWSYPPAWLAAVLAWIVVAVVDVLGGFDTDGYRATVWEWLGYGGGSLLLVGWYSGLWSEIVRRFREPENVQVEETACITLQDIENAPWEEIEAWLGSDEPAGYDFLGNQSVAQRVSFRVSEGTRSVGIVGPYGAGKTSIISWITDRLERHEIGGRKFFVCHHSCWGFETSASAIHDMLGAAVTKLSAEIDTFQVDSLPESYRKTFSAGGDWVETISNLVLRNPDPMEQFSRLSDLLGDIGGRLVFIVEDLDRNETRNFEIQEVLAFLERLKEYPNLSFVLTGGLSSSQRIDYAKLCDHIEFLRTIQPHHSSQIIKKVCERCWDITVFLHVRFGDPNRNYEWNDLTDGIFSAWREMSLPEAVAELLVTPRSLRHALSNTYTCWSVLHGEIDLRHLIGVNVLRYAAPEALNFLIRHWIHLKQAPNSKIMPNTGESKMRERLREDWNHAIQGVDWDIRAALQVMHFLLPATECWLVSDDVSGMGNKVYQGVHEERYWRRAINGTVDNDDVRDQEVIRHIQAWKDAQGNDTELVAHLASSPQYGEIWATLFHVPGGKDCDKLRSLCEQVIQRVLLIEGSSGSFQSGGLGRVVRTLLQRQSDQKQNLKWLKQVISQISSSSLLMTRDIWQQLGHSDSLFIDPTDRHDLRAHILSTFRTMLANGRKLGGMLSQENSAVLFQTVFDPGITSTKILADVQSWTWLGPHILATLRTRNAVAAANCGVLLGARVSGREQMTVDTEVLDQFFGDDASEVIDILESMIDQLPEADQSLVRNVVETARKHLAGRALPDDPEGEIDDG